MRLIEGGIEAQSTVHGRCIGQYFLDSFAEDFFSTAEQGRAFTVIQNVRPILGELCFILSFQTAHNVGEYAISSETKGR